MWQRCIPPGSRLPRSASRRPHPWTLRWSMAQREQRLSKARQRPRPPRLRKRRPHHLRRRPRVRQQQRLKPPPTSTTTTPPPETTPTTTPAATTTPSENTGTPSQIPPPNELPITPIDLPGIPNQAIGDVIVDLVQLDRDVINGAPIDMQFHDAQALFRDTLSVLGGFAGGSVGGAIRGAIGDAINGELNRLVGVPENLHPLPFGPSGSADLVPTANVAATGAAGDLSTSLPRVTDQLATLLHY